ncbi:MAG: aminopeptidase N [Betaproteobacteria bacterium]|nr:aminopeptidase N [Betaproteobacteria bacterium]
MLEGASSVVVHRADYAPPAYWIRHVDLTFDLDAAKTIVASRLSLQRNPDAEPGQALKLHGEGLNLLRVMSGSDSVSFRHEDGFLVIDNPPAGEQFTLEIRNTCAPDKNTELSGLYASGSGLFTQCEAEGFRRITFFLDRPDVMATFSVTLRADKAKFPVLLSNGNLVEEGELDNGRHFAKWHDPFPKPSYLFALVAAHLVSREQRIVSRSGKEHLLQVWVKPGDLDKTEHAMRSLVASVVWDEVRFGLPLDLDRFMIVAVEDFNMGAMENKGLNLFNTKFVLASPATATDMDYAGIESVVAHEYFHNWTGNRITCRDWFQLSLKEGLTVFRDQEFSMDMAGDASARAVKRIEDVRALRAAQFPEDAGPMAHPVRPEHYAAIDNFYTATVYEKGAEVVRMMHTLVGREGFARGMTLYFQRHDGQAVTCDDFAQAIADANPGSALATHLEVFKRWYAQAGTPCVVFTGITGDVVPSLLRGFSAPVMLRDGLQDEDLLTLLAHDSDAFNRWEASQRLLLSRMLRVLESQAPFEAPLLDDALAQALRAVLRHPTLDASFKELALTLPSEGYVAEQVRSIDPQRIHAVRETLRRDMASALHDDWVWAFEAHQVREGYDPGVRQAGRRALSGLALQMLCVHAAHTGNEVWPGRAYQRVKDANNMTERLAALQALITSHAALSGLALEHFHALYRHEPLVLDKWFALQAAAPEPLGDTAGSTFQRVKTLMQHPDFNLRNPNRARSLLFGLCMQNPAAFHRSDAAGYVFWADRVLELDASNPALAARLSRALDRWRQLATPWREAAREAIARVASAPKLSADTREIVTRSLQE